MKPNAAPRTLADCQFYVGYPIVDRRKRRTLSDVLKDAAFATALAFTCALLAFLYLSRGA